jgi:G3E family GTPase
VISKCDLVDGERLGALTAMLRLLNPTAKILCEAIRDEACR